MCRLRLQMQIFYAAVLATIVTNAFITTNGKRLLKTSSNDAGMMSRGFTYICRSTKTNEISYDEESLSKLKVVELKQILATIPVEERKGSSKSLTKKADIIDFLVKFYSSNVEKYVNNSKENLIPDTSTKKNLKSSSKVRAMPSLVDEGIINPSTDVDETVKVNKSIADEYNEYIFERYPPLNPELYEDNYVPDFKGVGSEDIR